MASEDGDPYVATLEGSNGSVLTFGPALPRNVDGYEFVNFWMSLSADGLMARSLVCTIEGGSGPYCLGQFLRELAEDWRGARPSRDFESIEHDLSIAARRDPLGHVVLRFTLRENCRADAWAVQVEATVDAGEDMASFARNIARLLDSA